METTVNKGKPENLATLPFEVDTTNVTDIPYLALAAAGGKLHLAYFSKDSICYSTRSLESSTWQQADCQLYFPGALNLKMAVTGNGTVILAFEAGNPTKVSVLLRAPDGKYTLLPDLDNSGYPGRNPAIAIDGSGKLTVAWEQARVEGLGHSYNSEVLARSWQGNIWGPVASISGFNGSSTSVMWSASAPAVAAEANGPLHFAYVLFAPGEDYKGPLSALIYRSGTLTDLQPPEIVVKSEAGLPSIALGNGRVELAWQSRVGSIIGLYHVDNSEIMWSRRSNNSWAVPRNISNSSGISFWPQAVIEPDGNTLVVWKEPADYFTPGSLMLTRSINNGQDWPPKAEPDTEALTKYTRRADSPVAQGQVSRSWVWGPISWKTQTEPYMESPGAQRTVFYYDKARIEVTNPNKDPAGQFYFTNGLLVTEMASGRLQLGDQLYATIDPARVPVAGDPDNSLSPTYASFRPLVYLPEIGQDVQAPNRSGQRLNQCINRAGVVSTCTSAWNVTYSHFVSETGHNIPAPFWNYLNLNGPVLENGNLVNGSVFNWVSTMGYPIAEAYWTRAMVGGVEKDVLVQLFQRRVLTYTPTNNAGFQVEMGNVGQHYYRWRFGSAPWS